MYYSYPCPKCGILITDFEDGSSAEWNADERLEGLVKDHFLQMHTEGEQLMTDEELLYSIKTGVQSSDEKPY